MTSSTKNLETDLLEIQMSDAERVRLQLWHRWEVTFAWFGYSPALKRIHIALAVHQHPWSTRSLATYTQLPHTTVRRHLAKLEKVGAIERVTNGFQISESGFAAIARFHGELASYVRGGCNISSELLETMRETPIAGRIDFETLEKHVWYPVLPPSATPDRTL